MPYSPAPTPTAPGHLAANVLHFARLLRGAGMPVGTDRVQLALQALACGALDSRPRFKAALAACLVSRAEHRALFDQAFDVFWRDPDLQGRMMAMLLPKVAGAVAGTQARDPARANRRLADAMFGHPHMPAPPPRATQERIELDVALHASEEEVLRRRDFELMTADEWRQAQRLVARLGTALPPLATRRQRRHPTGRQMDWRATLADMARQGGDLGRIHWQRASTQPAPLVVLADISGSMSRYARMLLQFAHALAQNADLAVHSFVFGTHLTNVTRPLRQRDPDAAVAEVARHVTDWSGGTRIGDCLRVFNRHWARRVLGSGRATVLLVTDGLERGEPAPLGFEMERLSKSCRRLIWLNPLLRYAQFEARAAGVRAMRPHVDLFLPAHNLQSLTQLVALLSQGAPEALQSPHFNERLHPAWN